MSEISLEGRKNLPKSIQVAITVLAEFETAFKEGEKEIRALAPEARAEAYTNLENLTIEHAKKFFAAVDAIPKEEIDLLPKEVLNAYCLMQY